MEAGGGVAKAHSKLSRGASVSFASAPSSASEESGASFGVCAGAPSLLAHAPFDPEEFLRPVMQSDLVDRCLESIRAMALERLCASLPTPLKQRF